MGYLLVLAALLASAVVVSEIRARRRGRRAQEARGGGPYREADSRDGNDWNAEAPSLRVVAEPPTKHRVFLDLLTVQRRIFVVFDARDPRVVLPDFAKRGPAYRLEYGLDYPIASPQVRAEREGVNASNRYAERLYATFVPWDAVFAIYTPDGAHGVVWTTSVPDGVDA